MKTFILRIALLVFFALTSSTFAQLTVVGYINRQIVPGVNLVANQLNTADNSLNHLFNSGSGLVPNGATFTKWDSVNNVYLPVSVYNLALDSWSINYSLNLGEGGSLNSPSSWVNTFVGEVVPYKNIGSDLGGTEIWAPGYADGFHLVACPMPIAGSISNMFANVVGRSPELGESVTILNESSQTYITATFDGSAWDNNPTLPVAQSAWFNLGPVNVPEPSTLALGLTAMAFCFLRRRTR
jgi:hypothetical protein